MLQASLRLRSRRRMRSTSWCMCACVAVCCLKASKSKRRVTKEHASPCHGHCCVCRAHVRPPGDHVPARHAPALAFPRVCAAHGRHRVRSQPRRQRPCADASGARFATCSLATGARASSRGAGLRSKAVGERAEAIMFFPVLFERFPFAQSITSAFLKLADLFMTGCVHTSVDMT